MRGRPRLEEGTSEFRRPTAGRLEFQSNMVSICELNHIEMLKGCISFQAACRKPIQLIGGLRARIWDSWYIYRRIPLVFVNSFRSLLL